ncbi:META domain-containing protein [Tellurirhabdus rosea]|uniref:META domain-containing protein n=1 Tax=Tellurirhabdus rosea TaxID=2674997 RepID=UPI0022588D2C|nr:META domain-containing protein [Tellurirhabdus rosea]
MRTTVWLWVLICSQVLFFSCSRKNRRDRSAERAEKADAKSEKNSRGIDFTAVGAQNAWALAIDFSGDMEFRPVGSSVVKTITPKPQRTTKGRGVLFDARQGTRPLRVGIEPTVYRDKASGQEYAYTVWVESGGKRYTGGGGFLYGALRLSDTWVLETFRGQRMRPEQFAGRMPRLELDVKGNNLRGFSGCNEIRGKVKAEGDRIELEPNPATKKYCASSFEESFLRSLRGVTLYRVSRNRLTLLSNGKYVMTFRKEGGEEEDTRRAAR